MADDEDSGDYAEDEFDGEPDESQPDPPLPWYRTNPAVLAGGGLGLAVIAGLVAAVVLASGSADNQTGPLPAFVEPTFSTTATAPATTASSITGTATTTRVSTSDISSRAPTTTSGRETTSAPAPSGRSTTRVRDSPTTRTGYSVAPTRRTGFSNN